MRRFLTIASAVTLTMALASPAVAGDAKKGQGVYMNFCAPCHATGAAGAPKVGDKAAWAAHLKHGEKHMVERAIKGFQGEKGFMPPRGGNSALSDAEVANAVAYMISQSK
ncbi:MAG: cytochrome c5 family protein [Deltaproteobacteria bacterium]|nr:MAG: cytochrome c5 family protein [Deltaproteobacteria bacterium]